MLLVGLCTLFLAATMLSLAIVSEKLNPPPYTAQSQHTEAKKNESSTKVATTVKNGHHLQHNPAHEVKEPPRFNTTTRPPVLLIGAMKCGTSALWVRTG